MKRIKCSICGNNNDFFSQNDKPSECNFCFSEFEPSIAINEISGSDKTPQLQLTYQKTAEVINLKTEKKIFLGREHQGATIFSNILISNKPVISRLHASIELIDGSFFLKDENSLNGTFIGKEKINCKNNPQKIEHNSLFYLGKEPFILTIVYDNCTDEILEDKIEPENAPADFENSKTYYCSNCGVEAKEIPANKICLKCNSFNSFAIKN